MKFSISLPDTIAKEIRHLSKTTNRSISYWLKRAWLEARHNLHDPKEDAKREREALTFLASTQGVLQKDFPDTTSLQLQKSAFKAKK